MSEVAAWKRLPAPSVTRIFLCRHAATLANEVVPYILQGCELDGPLTTRGELQAKSLADALHEVPLAAAYCSPMQRARQTASIVVGHREITLQPEPDLKECSVGRWEGLSWEDIRTRDGEAHDRFQSDPVTQPHPGGESYQDVLDRAAPVLERIGRAHPGQNVVVVAHNMVNRILLSHYLGTDLKHARRLKQANCCINWIEFEHDQFLVQTLNSVWHVPG